jgi:16S rRNA (uracil1498-N3)-methyltransferase
MADRFYINSDLAPGMVVLRGTEAHHLAAVCRARPGDPVCLFNGDGNEYPGRVMEITRRDVAIEILSRAPVSRELPFALRIAAPLPKGDRGQFLIEKLTELGVTALTILDTERSVVQLGRSRKFSKPAGSEARFDRLDRHVVEASKQCGRNVLMRVEPPRAWADFVRDERLPARRLLAHPGSAARVALPAGASDVVAAVGPEGGFTDEEVALAVAAGWQAVGLGPRILRVETAAIALAALLGACS